MKRRGLFLLTLLMLVMAGMTCIPEHKAYAATGPAYVYSVEYYDENIIVYNNGNSKIYFATDVEAARGNWSVVPADTGKFTMIDFSWLQASSESILVIKGDANETQSRVMITRKPARLSVTINYANLDSLAASDSIASVVNIQATVGTGAKPIIFDDLEWKKGNYGQWTSTSSLTAGMLQKLLVRGTNIFFRIRAVDDYVGMTMNGTPVNLNQNRALGITGGIRAYENMAVTYGSDYPDGTDGRRCSDELRLKLPKRADTMVSGVDGSKFTAAIPFGKEYRVTVNYSDNTTGKSGWTKVTDRSVRTLPLATLANAVTPRKMDVNNNPIVYDGMTVAFPSMLIEVRNSATSNAASSNTTEIALPAQRTLTKAIKTDIPDATVPQDASDIYVNYFGDKYIILTIPAATADLPYEYCITKPGDILNLNYASWTSVTKGTDVKIQASRAVDNATLYVRQKEIKSKKATRTAAAVSYKLASTYVSHKISYMSVPLVTKSNLTYVKGYSGSPVTITVQLNASGKTGFESVIKSIKLGTKDIGFTTTIAPHPSDSSISMMTITLKSDSLSSMTNCTNRALTITFAGGTTDRTSVKLTIKNPTQAGSLTLSAVKGDTAGTTKISVVSPLGAGNSWVYTIDDAAVTGKYSDDVLPQDKGTAYTTGSEITVAVNKYVTIYELNATRNIVKYKSVQITSDNLK